MQIASVSSGPVLDWSDMWREQLHPGYCNWMFLSYQGLFVSIRSFCWRLDKTGEALAYLGQFWDKHFSHVFNFQASDQLYLPGLRKALRDVPFQIKSQAYLAVQDLQQIQKSSLFLFAPLLYSAKHKCNLYEFSKDVMKECSENLNKTVRGAQD